MTTTNRRPWTPAENAALVRLYFEMLDRITAQEGLNKAAMIRHEQRVLTGPAGTERGPLSYRSRGSIEAKLMNASAAHAAIDPNAVTMASHGYKAWGNYQASLKDAMHAEWLKRVDCDYLNGMNPADGIS